MQYKAKMDGIEYVYDIEFDQKELKSLLNEIIRNCSYGVVGTYTFDYGSNSLKINHDQTKITDGASLINGDPEYVDIQDISYYQYEHPGDSISIKGTKIIPPELAKIVDRILKNDSKALKDLINYPNNIELIPIEMQIETLNNDIKDIDDFDVDNKINSYKKLKALLYRKANNEFFDPELLKSFYERVTQLISFKLIRTITYHDGPNYSFNQLLKKNDEEVIGTPGRK